MTYSTERRIEFRDTDAAGIVHFSAFFPMMEAAEHEMLRSLGISVMPQADDSGKATSVTWPRVSARCDYVSAARFEDVLAIEVQVARIGTTSVEYHFRFSRDGQRIAEGAMTAVCCRLKRHGDAGQSRGGQSSGDKASGDKASGGLQKTPIPDAIRQQLAQYH